MSERTIEQRRARLLAALNATGGQSRRYFIRIAEAGGYNAVIDDGYGETVFRVGRNRTGQPLNSTRWAHVWRMDLVSLAPALAARREDLEDIIRRAAPSHTVVFFNYLQDE